jgi:hypothetical protein
MSHQLTIPLPATKVCTDCKRELPDDAFGRESRLPGGRALQCKECKNARNKRNKRPNRCYRCKRVDPPEGMAASGYCRVCEKDRLAAYYAKNKEALLEQQREWYAEHREYAQTRDKGRRIALRTEVLAAYGGVCQCCGEARYEFLAIDHAFGDGKAHRAKSKAASSGKNFYYWLKERGFPQDEGLRVLCHNCNNAIGFYGYCPHQREDLSRSQS